MPAKLERCVEKVRKRNSGVNAYAVCKASLMRARKTYSRVGHRIMQGGRIILTGTRSLKKSYDVGVGRLKAASRRPRRFI